MKPFARHRYMFFILMAGIVLFCVPCSTAQNPATGYWAMKGNLYQHPFIDYTDSLSAQQIFELRNENGLPLWFCRDISKNVCLTSECRMMHLWLFWNSTGNYLGHQLHEKDPLTKTDHTPFNSDDYQKFNRILSDPSSILKDLKLEDLIIQPAPEDEKVDGHSGATQPSLKEYLIKDAAYTCYTLWHTAYGNTQKEIKKLLEMRIDSAYPQLVRLENLENPLVLEKLKPFLKHENLYVRYITQKLLPEFVNK